MRVCLPMSSPIAHPQPLPSPCRFPARVRLAAEWSKPLLAEILAFWALWHCRHARPPDAASASY
ncbi:conserved hypothetical protein [Pseudomonas sp. 8AS]|nr:conserved hypothetical protein [Pseudomonas sp. 8AS]